MRRYFSSRKHELLSLYHNSASEMLRNEHQRWHGWTWTFLGIIATTFYANDNLSISIPDWILFIFASFVSFLWLVAMLNIKASTYSWHKVIKEIENDILNTGVFNRQNEIHRKFSRLRAFLTSFCIIKSKYSSKSDVGFFHSVTNTLIVLSFVLCILFLSLGICNLGKKYKEIVITIKLYGTNTHEHAFVIVFMVLFVLFYLLALLIRKIDVCISKCKENEKTKI